MIGALERISELITVVAGLKHSNADSKDLMTVERLNKCIGYVREARDIHVQHIQRPEFQTTDRGNVEWHNTWVSRYDQVIALLEECISLIS